MLIRRLTFDLTGLPPTPEEVDAFLADNRPDAYERLVDRLLASPRFGERMASLWLPLARYAEDQAHQVGERHQVLLPERVASTAVGDRRVQPRPAVRPVRHAPARRRQDRRARRRTTWRPSASSGSGPKYYNRGRLEVMADEWEDRVDTVTRTMLGLTVACARCHDHKFDPITQRRLLRPGRRVRQHEDGQPARRTATAQKGELDAEKVDPDTRAHRRGRRRRRT